MVRNRLAELHKRTGFEEKEITESENQPLKKQFKQHEEEFLNKVGTIWFLSSFLAHRCTKALPRFCRSANISTNDSTI